MRLASSGDGVGTSSISARAPVPTNLTGCIFPALPLVSRMAFRDIVDPSVSPARHSVTSAASAGDAITTGFARHEVRVAELRQLFNAIDPSPFRERDFDPRAQEFIVEWARDLPRDASLALRVHLERCAGRGARSKCSCTTGGPFWAKCVSSTASAGCR